MARRTRGIRDRAPTRTEAQQDAPRQPARLERELAFHRLTDGHLERIHHLVRCALLHYEFEVLHPYLDGNGRLRRLLIVFFLVEHGALPSPLLYLGSYFEQHRSSHRSVPVCQAAPAGRVGGRAQSRKSGWTQAARPSESSTRART
jgi:Fic family protein